MRGLQCAPEGLEHSRPRWGLSEPFPDGAPAGGFSLASRGARLASEGFRSRSYAATTTLSTPDCRRDAATSEPIKPIPTTALRPGAISARMRSQSSTVRRS